MSSINVDSLLLVFSYVPRHCIPSCLATCKFWYHVGIRDELWQIFYERDFALHQPLGAGEAIYPESFSSGQVDSSSEEEEEDEEDEDEDEEEEEEEEAGDRVTLDSKEKVVKAITGMGFSQNAAEWAWKESSNRDVEGALEWILSHMDDPILHQPVPRKKYGVDSEALNSLISMGFSLSLKSMIFALKKHRNNLAEAINWIVTEPVELQLLKDEEKFVSDYDNKSGTFNVNITTSTISSPNNTPINGLEETCDMYWMQRYKESWEQSLVTVMYASGPFIKKGGSGSAISEVTLTTGFCVPTPLAVPFADGYGSAFVIEIDVTLVPDRERVTLPFDVCCLIASITSACSTQPKSMGDFPPHLNAVMQGDTLTVVYFYNPPMDRYFDEMNKDNAIEFFLSIDRKKWNSNWKPPYLANSIPPGKRFMLFLLYKHTKEFLRLYKTYHSRSCLATGKKRIGGLNTNPYTRTRCLKSNLVQSILNWTTLSHCAFFLHRPPSPLWPNQAPVWEYKMYLNSFSIKNRQGSGGIIIFESKPKMKNAYNHSSVSHSDVEEFDALMQIESDVEDYWDYNF
eukprot:TRINITY_DN4275_c0_g2_i1.p1 TRINITY_DN4275_c0_g2~~TRINITY_DN4275_c0_g2_i1.p1  ORF type:complete len:569 (-),score=112.54 TRINITY_DN4275_c0_g2_i1:1322-3028(-)